MPRALLHLTRRGASWWALSRVGSSYHASWHDAGDPRVTFRVSIRADFINLSSSSITSRVVDCAQLLERI